MPASISRVLINAERLLDLFTLPSMLLAITNSVWSILGLAIICCGIRWKRTRSKLPLPPGPKKLPLLGNLFSIPAERPWETYLQWSKEFSSDIIHLDVAGRSIVVLSSMEAIGELLERRSSLYSDRPRMVMLNELLGLDYGIALIDFSASSLGDLWLRSLRKIFHQSFNIVAAKQFYPKERAATNQLLRRLLIDPHKGMEHFRHMAAALIMDVTYGITVLPSNDPYIDLAEEVMHVMSFVSVPGRFLVETVPVLKYVPSWFPGADLKRKAEKWRPVMRELLESPFKEAKRNIATGNAPPSFTSISLGALDVSKDNETQETAIKVTAANMYAGASDTTVSALGTFLLGILANPEAQRKAQVELDSVIGHGNLPDFTDEASLPYVSAIVKEVLRWKNVTALATPHYLQVDDEYRGYRIPAGSVVIGNAWAILHDEDMYPDPHSFKPERFLLEGKLNRAVRDPETAAFGFGRRICPGRHMALASLWITIASILATMNINNAVDDDGKVIEPSYEYFSGMISTPLPFKCSITPRSRQAMEAIQATVGGA
ncbi:cytochrome P450 [Mycena epipterygia]|nr:cytochrome P450 [Mycena epipterygia]